MTKMKTIKIYDTNQRMMPNWRPDGVVDLIEWLTNLLKDVPPEYHDQVILEFDHCEGVETEEVIFYVRPETEKETLEKEALIAASMARKEKYEREQYEILKAKFDS